MASSGDKARPELPAGVGGVKMKHGATAEPFHRRRGRRGKSPKRHRAPTGSGEAGGPPLAGRPPAHGLGAIVLITRHACGQPARMPRLLSSLRPLPHHSARTSQRLTSLMVLGCCAPGLSACLLFKASTAHHHSCHHALQLAPFITAVAAWSGHQTDLGCDWEQWPMLSAPVVGPGPPAPLHAGCKPRVAGTPHQETD